MLIERKKVSEIVLDKLKYMIKTGEFPPNSRIPSETELAEMFGVSRSPIREALSVLSVSGLIESRQGGRSWVKDVNLAEMLEPVQFEMITIEEVLDLLEMRTIIESQSAYLATKRHTLQDIKDLNKSLEDFGMTVKDDYTIGFEADHAFHQIIVRATYNPFLIQAFENLSDLHLKAVKFSLSKNLGWERKRKEVFSEHERIYHAIKHRDGERAKQAVIDHLTNVRDKLIDSQLSHEKDQGDHQVDRDCDII
ncbi:MAG TPA: FadR/GntR family transcriptional regulator [Virgibacillus sp.]|nr:FadR/GntR family transcriptional regulator [Virgibacillus sp.]